MFMIQNHGTLSTQTARKPRKFFREMAEFLEIPKNGRTLVKSFDQRMKKQIKKEQKKNKLDIKNYIVK